MNAAPTFPAPTFPALTFVALPSDLAQAYRAGAPDANGQPAERDVSDGAGVPCRHCLSEVAAGEPYLILAHRPFPTPQPYAELGPIFLHAGPCRRHPDSAETPAMLLGWERLLIRGYGQDDRIVYGSRQIVATGDLAASAQALLARPDTAYVHVRSASNNCYQCRIERG